MTAPEAAKAIAALCIAGVIAFLVVLAIRFIAYFVVLPLL